MNSDYTIVESVANNTISSDSSDNKNALSIMDLSEPERLVLFRSIIQETSRKITSSVTVEELTEMFRDIPSFKKKYNRINNYYNVLTKCIHDNVNKRVEEFIGDTNLCEKFGHLEKLIHDSSIKSGTIAWRPSHDVDRNLKSYFMQEKMKHKNHLKRVVSKKEDTVNKLQFEVNTARSRVRNVAGRLKAAEQRLMLMRDEMEMLNYNEPVEINQK